ncbi:MAG: Aspartate-semialdehyde dehydrogenase, partial [uncultured Phycisphaerae bacterium]
DHARPGPPDPGQGPWRAGRRRPGGQPLPDAAGGEPPGPGAGRADPPGREPGRRQGRRAVRQRGPDPQGGGDERGADRGDAGV